jgi:putative phosphoribosyl transferase
MHLKPRRRHHEQARLRSYPLFEDRLDAGRRLAEVLLHEGGHDVLVVGLARGGVEVAAAVAGALRAPLDVVAVRKIGHPCQPEYALGAVTPGDGVYVRAADGLAGPRLAQVVSAAQGEAAALDRRLHVRHPPVDLGGRVALLVDDGLATGATMVAAARWARAAGASRVVAAVPVAAAASASLIRAEVDELFVLYELSSLVSVGHWYRWFDQVEDEDVLRLLDESAARASDADFVGSAGACRP